MDKMIILILGLMVLLVGCVEQQQEIIVEENSYSSEDFVNILEQKNPELCLDFNDEDVNGSFAKNYLYNINTEETFLFKDVCLIYTISLVENHCSFCTFNSFNCLFRRVISTFRFFTFSFILDYKKRKKVLAE